METPESILTFWLGERESAEAFPADKEVLWWKGGEALDSKIRERFEPVLERIVAGELADWLETPRGRLATIIVIDQFSRNIYRGSGRAFAQDSLALRATLEGMERGHDRQLLPLERYFFYMPLMHSESEAIQERGIRAFEVLAEAAPEAVKGKYSSALDYAIRHYQIVRRFGRFPHRNERLGRPSTPEELAFLAEPGSSFG